MPLQINRSEDAEQAALFHWSRLNYKIYPGLEFMFSINNGSKLAGNQHQRMIAGARLKRMGLVRGVPDVFLPVRKQSYGGLFIELKSESGRPSPEQLRFGEVLLKAGYCWKVCRGWEAAVSTIMAYYDD